MRLVLTNIGVGTYMQEVEGECVRMDVYCKYVHLPLGSLCLLGFLDKCQ